MTAEVYVINNELTEQRNKIHKSIQTFLASKGQKSVNTMEGYGRSVRQFFLNTRSKEINELTLMDLSFTLDEVQAYQIELTKQYKTTTVDNKINAVRSLYKYLSGNNYDVNPNWFNVESLVNYDAKSYEVLEWDVVEDIMEAVKKHKHGDEKALFIEVGAKTSFRVETLLTLKWSDIKLDRHGVRFIEVLGKGKEWDKKPIQEELYERLLTLKEDDTEDVFPHLNNRKIISRMMIKVCEELGLDAEKVKFHSMKKAGMHEVGLITGGNIKAIQQQGNHKSELTSLKFYTKENENLAEMPCLLIGAELDTTPLEALSKEELLQLIANSGREVQMKLLQNIKKED
ncbi:tyrosine-type recombinase/integrase [Bacillus cereus]|nr:tyrosine-type recombinase/integrase [Bacillus cereus]